MKSRFDKFIFIVSTVIVLATHVLLYNLGKKIKVENSHVESVRRNIRQLQAEIDRVKSYEVILDEMTIVGGISDLKTTVTKLLENLQKTHNFTDLNLTFEKKKGTSLNYGEVLVHVIEVGITFQIPDMNKFLLLLDDLYNSLSGSQLLSQASVKKNAQGILLAEITVDYYVLYP